MNLIKDILILNERVNMKNLKRIKTNIDDLYDKKLLGRFVNENYSEITDKQAIKTIITNYYEMKNEGVSITYKYLRGIKTRKQPSKGHSLINLSRVFRHTIARDIYWDIDIKNCHPVLLIHHAKKFGVELPRYEDYIVNRDYYLNILMNEPFNFTRDQAKTYPLKTIYRGSPFDELMKKFQGAGDIYFLKEMYDEVGLFWDCLGKTEEGKKYLKRARTNRDSTKTWNNEVGTALSFFFCAKENDILTVMCENVRTQGFEIGAYCYDGMMVYKKDLDVDLKQVEDYVHEILEYEIKLDFKQMDEGIPQEVIDALPKEEDIDELDDLHIECDFFSNDKYYIDFIQEYDGKKYESHNEMIRDFIPEVSKYVAHYEMGAGQWIIKTNKNEKFKLHDKGGEVSVFIGDKKYTLFGTGKGFVNIYKVFRSFFPNYNQIVCKPNECDVERGDFNTWKGFRVKPSERCNLFLIEPFLYHLREVWCSGDLVLYRYILSWLSRIVREPWNKTGVVLVVYGTEGCGKNVITEFLTRKVLGSGCAIEGEGVDELVNKFNNSLQGKVLYVANEIPLVKDEFNTTFEKLKNVITGSSLRIEQKGKDSYEVDNLLNIIATTNNSYSFKISKMDRRYLPFEVNNSKRGNLQYFKDLYDCLNNDDVACNVMKYLLDYEGVVLHPIPMTALKEEMADRSMNSLERFFQYLKDEIADNPETALLGEKGFGVRRLYSCNELWVMYIGWCSETGESSFKQSYFKQKVGKVLGGSIKKRRDGERKLDVKYTCYILDFNQETSEK
jgi:hypothetical protein